MPLSGRETGAAKTQANAWVFLCLASSLSFFAAIAMNHESLFADVSSLKPAVVEELSDEEKQAMIQEMLAEGDRFLDGKSYNAANAAYESVFQLDPENAEASKRIDRLKKRLIAEAKTETELVGGAYDQEIEFRAGRYWEEANQFFEQGKWGQARLALQKFLLLQPLHKEARALYERVQKQIDEARS